MDALLRAELSCEMGMDPQMVYGIQAAAAVPSGRTPSAGAAGSAAPIYRAPTEAGIIEHNILLDSWLRVRGAENLVKGIILFDLSEIASNSSQITLTQPVTNVHSMQASTIQFPILSATTITFNPAVGASGHNANLPVLTDNLPTTVTISPLTASNRLNLLIQEFESSATRLRNGMTSHFEFQLALAETTDLCMTGTPLKGSTTRMLQSIAQTLTHITCVFTSPDSVVSLPIDQFSTSDGLTVDADSSERIYMKYQDHGLVAGDRVFITGFHSAYSQLDAYMNRSIGQIIGHLGLTSETFYFHPDVSVAGITPDTSRTNADGSFAGTVRVYIEKNRIRIPMKLICVDSTNRMMFGS